MKKKTNINILKFPGNISDLERSLEDKMGLNVVIQNKKNNSGKIFFEYKNLDQLDRLIEIIKQNY